MGLSRNEKVRRKRKNRHQCRVLLRKIQHIQKMEGIDPNTVDGMGLELSNIQKNVHDVGDFVFVNSKANIPSIVVPNKPHSIFASMFGMFV